MAAEKIDKKMPAVDFAYSGMYIIQRNQKIKPEQILQQDLKTWHNRLHYVICPTVEAGPKWKPGIA